jgi:hypothetical protein
MPCHFSAHEINLRSMELWKQAMALEVHMEKLNRMAGKVKAALMSGNG